MATVRTNYEEIVDVSRIAVSKDDWVLQKVEEAIKNNPREDIMDILARVKKMKPFTVKELVDKALKEILSPAVKDLKKIALLIIDVQNDFSGDGTLAVPGAEKDIERLTKFIYQNMDKITQIFLSMDTHPLAAVFHQMCWQDESGNPIPYYTSITKEKLDEGKATPIYAPNAFREYVEGLDRTGRIPLTIWPYHCVEGTEGWLPEQQLMNMVNFHSAARRTRPQFIQKGKNPKSEMYGIFREEYSPNGATVFNTNLMQVIAENDVILFAGEAKSHCALTSFKQFIEMYENQPEILAKLIFLDDCSSCIPGTEAETEEEFKKLVKKYHIRVESSTQITL